MEDLKRKRSESNRRYYLVHRSEILMKRKSKKTKTTILETNKKLKVLRSQSSKNYYVNNKVEILNKRKKENASMTIVEKKAISAYKSSKYECK